MAITRNKKEEIVAKLEGVSNEAASVVFVGFSGLSVVESTEVRSTLRSEGVSYFVPKKTLLKRAFGDKFTGEMPELQGEVAVAYSTDPIAPAQHVKTFAEKYKDRVNILGGVFEGAYKSREEMTEIASIPPLQVLRGMFVNVINSPIQGLVISLNQIADKKSA